jgi:hypothetical protein
MGGGPVFEGRYREQAVPTKEDIEDRFFYCALQPVSAGLCARISEYPGYNSFSDAISGIKRKFKIVDWYRYGNARRRNPLVSKAKYTTEYELEYDRLPGYEDMPRKEYRELMLKKLEERRQKVIDRLMKENPKRRFMTKKELQKAIPGTPAKNPKKSSRYSKRPLVLTKCHEAKTAFLNWYFTIYGEYKIAVRKYMAGDFAVVFPPGTYRPPGVMTPPPT